MTTPRLVVLDANALSLLGMKTLLERVVPQVEVWAFSDFDELLAVSSSPIAHYFVSSQMIVEHVSFFQEHRQQTIVMGIGGALAGTFHCIDINVEERQLVRNLLRLMSTAHSHGKHLPPRSTKERTSPLSPREIEVLVLIVKGYINKEIAEMLCISLTTVISHRKNIMDKLELRSVSALTIYAVVNGYVEATEI